MRNKYSHIDVVAPTYNVQWLVLASSRAQCRTAAAALSAIESIFIAQLPTRAGESNAFLPLVFIVETGSCE